MAIRRRSLLLCATALLSTAATLWVLFWLLEPSTPVTPVSFDTLTADAQAGRLLQLSIHGREYTYIRYDPQHSPAQSYPSLRATGPEPTLASVRALCLSPDGSHRRIEFER